MSAKKVLLQTKAAQSRRTIQPSNHPTNLPEPLPEYLTREQATAFFGRSVDYLKRRGLIQPIVAPVGRGRGGKRTYYPTAECQRVHDELAKFETALGVPQ